MSINFVSHGGVHQVAIVLCPNISRRFLHLSKDVSPDTSWVLRDYIGGQQIVRRNHSDAEELENIEQEVWLSLEKDQVLFVKYQEVETWKENLKKLSENIINAPDLNGEPQGFTGFWEPLD